MFAKFFASATVAHAHCDLYCGVYDPAQAKIEALSVVKTAKKYAESDDEVFRARCISIKEARAEETKHHLMVLWADFFAPDHFAAFRAQLIGYRSDAGGTVFPEDAQDGEFGIGRTGDSRLVFHPDFD